MIIAKVLAWIIYTILGLVLETKSNFKTRQNKITNTYEVSQAVTLKGSLTEH